MGEKELAREQFELCIAERPRWGLNQNHYFRAMALKELGRTDEAEALFDDLIALGNRRLQSTEADFFAKFGERETPDDKRSNAYYMIGLGYDGKQNHEESENMFAEAVRLNINHVWAAKFLSQIQKRSRP
jgi:tetratricopeptide (TPR) repeat protein